MLSSLLKIISNADNSVIHHHALETLYEVLAELSTRLLASGRKQFAEIAPELFQVVAQIYMGYVQKQKEIELQITASCIKCLRILMVSGIKDVHKYDETKVCRDRICYM